VRIADLVFQEFVCEPCKNVGSSEKPESLPTQTGTVVRVDEENIPRKRRRANLDDLTDEGATDGEATDSCSNNAPQGTDLDYRAANDSTSPAQNDVDTNAEFQQPDIRRSGTLNELERGLRHIRGDSRVQSGLSYGASVCQAFSRSPSNKQPNAPKYSLSQAFFIVAGGLAVETKSFHEEPYLTITPSGALELARLGLLSPVRKEIIDVKAKADPITKLVVCVQAGWFIVQCIARVAQDLPLTLLEIHVLAHVFVALLMYLFWFSKPYNALSPIVIKESRTVELAALFMLQKKRKTERKEESSTLNCALKNDDQEEKFRKVLSLQESSTIDRIAESPHPPSASNEENGHENVKIDASGPTIKKSRSEKNSSTNVNAMDHQRAVTNLILALRAIDWLKSRHIHFPYWTEVHGNRDQTGDNSIRHREKYLASYLPDFWKTPGGKARAQQTSTPSKRRPKIDFVYRFLPSQPWSIWVVILFVSYAAFHLSAWNAHFPTTIERWMWRGAGLAIVGLPVFPLLYFPRILFQIVFDIFDHAPKWVRSLVLGFFSVVDFIWWLIFWVVFLLVTLAAVAGRIYFLAEALASLRQPTPRIYDTVKWTQFWPHG